MNAVLIAGVRANSGQAMPVGVAAMCKMLYFKPPKMRFEHRSMVAMVSRTVPRTTMRSGVRGTVTALPERSCSVRAPAGALPLTFGGKFARKSNMSIVTLKPAASQGKFVLTLCPVLPKRAPDRLAVAASRCIFAIASSRPQGASIRSRQPSQLEHGWQATLSASRALHSLTQGATGCPRPFRYHRQSPRRGDHGIPGIVERRRCSILW